ncbi:MAG: hypothetical protein OXT67_04325 [Zetaproteobacteria bacterium]|nr:hypothetical protein [Zetaproteobacteria bacterium]
MPAKYRDIFTPLAAELNANVNPYAEKLHALENAEASNLFAGRKLLNCQGNWPQLFRARSADMQEPLHLILEIGAHHGRVINQMARENAPDYAFLGMDITLKRVVTTAQSAQAEGNSNVFSILGDARQVPRIFAPQELAGAFCFFPDPWEKKKRQRKHRLLNDAFASSLLTVVRQGGIFWLKTDSADYADFAQRSFESAGWSVCCKPLKGPFAGKYVSNFESMFESQGVGHYEVFCQR